MRFMYKHTPQDKKNFPPKLRTHIVLNVNRTGEKYIPRGGGQTPLLVLVILLVLVLVILLVLVLVMLSSLAWGGAYWLGSHGG